MNNIAKSFDWNVICQVCRQKIKASEALKRWDGLIVCKEDYETRHPLDMPAPKQAEERVLSFTSSEPVDEYVTGICTIQGRYGIAGYAVTGCSITGFGDAADITMPTATFNNEL